VRRGNGSGGQDGGCFIQVLVALYVSWFLPGALTDILIITLHGHFVWVKPASGRCSPYSATPLMLLEQRAPAVNSPPSGTSMFREQANLKSICM